MDEALVRQLVRQLKWLNFWVTFFGVLFLAALIVAGILLFKAVTFIHTGEQKISDIQTKTSQTLNVPAKACDNSQVSSILKQYTSACQ